MTFRTRMAVAASAAAVLASTALLAPSASGHPGHAGTASDAPKVLFAEDFEDGLNDGEVTTLDSYGDYTADAAWLDQANGNGLVSDGHTTDGDFTAGGFSLGNATAFGDLRAVASAIGNLNGTSPTADNHAVTAYTASVNPGANKVEFATENDITLTAKGRFLTISANIGAVNCHAAHPLINFFLTDDGGAEHAVNASALDGCGGSSSPNATATHLTGGDAMLFTSNKVGIVMRNAQGSGSGNDHAFDDIQVLDATPQLDKVFDKKGPLKRGETTDLILTITNTSERARKAGWSFTDHLPSGLTVAGPAVSTCTADIDAPTGAKQIEVDNGVLAQGAASCSITVPVVSKSKSGTFRNDASNIESVGLNAPAATAVKYVAPPEPKKDKKKSKDDDDDSDDDDDDGNGGKKLPSTGAPWYVSPWTGVGGILLAVGGTVGVARIRRLTAGGQL